MGSQPLGLGHRIQASQTMIISKEAIAREYAQILKHESQEAAINWTAAKLGITEQQVTDVVFEHEAVA